MTHDSDTPHVEDPQLVRPPVNYLQLVTSLLVLFLLAANVVSWFYYKEQLNERSGPRVASAPARGAGVAGSVSPQKPPAGDFTITNAHDHLYMLKHLDKYLKAAESLGIDRTLFVASSEFTFAGKGAKDKLNDWSSKEVLTAAKQNPGKIIPFVTLHPDDPAKTELIKGYIAEGAKGLKLYTGHSNFHDRPLDAPEMMEVYAFCEANNFPILWHIHMDKFDCEFKRVMEKHPNLTVIIPHFGVGFWNPKGPVFKEIEELLAIYPNLYIDTSFGTRDILVGGLEKVSADPELFRGFYERNQDRIVWGTDMVVTGNSEKTEAWIASVIRACRDVNEKERYTFWMAAQGSPYAYGRGNNTYGELRGLNLPPDILKKIYETNIDNVLAGGAKS